MSKALEEKSEIVELPSLYGFKENPNMAYWTYFVGEKGKFPVLMSWSIYHLFADGLYGHYDGIVRRTERATLYVLFSEGFPPCPRCDGDIREDRLPTRERDLSCIPCGFRISNWIEADESAETPYPSFMR